MKDFYTTRTAALYLGMSLRAVRYHVHVVKDLVADEVAGHALIFSRETLETFKKQKRPGGRPRTRAT